MYSSDGIHVYKTGQSTINADGGYLYELIMNFNLSLGVSDQAIVNPNSVMIDRTTYKFAVPEFKSIQQKLNIVFTWELFSLDDKSNAHLPASTYTPKDSAFRHQWLHQHFYGNPVYNDQFIYDTRS